jgi:hypothetical protein
MLAQTGPFTVPIRCTTKKVVPQLASDAVRFDQVVMGETTTFQLVVRNRGALPTRYAFVDPNTGMPVGMDATAAAAAAKAAAKAAADAEALAAKEAAMTPSKPSPTASGGGGGGGFDAESGLGDTAGSGGFGEGGGYGEVSHDVPPTDWLP